MSSESASEYEGALPSPTDGPREVEDDHPGQAVAGVKRKRDLKNEEGADHGKTSPRRRGAKNEGSDDVAATEATAIEEAGDEVHHPDDSVSESWDGAQHGEGGSAGSVGEEDDSLIFIPPEKVGHVIGSKGMVIQELQRLSGCKIILNQDFPPDVDRTMRFEGRPDQIAHAQDLVRKILKEGPNAIHPTHPTHSTHQSQSTQHGDTMTQEISCAQSRVGRVIGTGGSTIREIQNRSGAKVVVNQDFPEGADRKVIVSGVPHAVAMGVFLVNYVIQNGPLLPPASSPQEGVLMLSPMLPLGTTGNFTQTIEVEKSMVGKLIGKGGETISLMQKKSGARIQIEQNTHPCKVVMTGSPQVHCMQYLVASAYT